ncbi:MAG: Photosystem I reaction center subunit IX [Cyanobacteriota bacterium]
MEGKNGFLGWLSLAPTLLILFLSAHAVLLIMINIAYPDLLHFPFG